MNNETVCEEKLDRWYLQDGMHGARQKVYNKVKCGIVVIICCIISQ